MGWITQDRLDQIVTRTANESASAGKTMRTSGATPRAFANAAILRTSASARSWISGFSTPTSACDTITGAGSPRAATLVAAVSARLASTDEFLPALKRTTSG